MSEPVMIECVDCPTTFPQPAGPWGAKTLRCLPCRTAERRNRGNASSTGPTRIVGDLFKTASPEWHERLAGLALQHATGMPQDFATLCVEAINVLLAQNETPAEIRARLNPNPFGRLRAVEDGLVVGVRERSLEATIMEEFVG